jgi:sec-independent protein translocase protein TatA
MKTCNANWPVCAGELESSPYITRRRIEMIHGWEWVIILIVVLLVFGVGRISKLGEELGKGIQAFRQGVREGKADEESGDTNEEKETA